jgi:hypothetical protein
MIVYFCTLSRIFLVNTKIFLLHETRVILNSCQEMLTTHHNTYCLFIRPANSDLEQRINLHLQNRMQGTTTSSGIFKEAEKTDA